MVESSNEKYRKTDIFLILAAPSVLGFVVGWFMGENGPGENVLAAVLPAVISIGGLFLLPKIISSSKRSVQNLLSLCIILFALLLFLGANTAAFVRKAGYERIVIEETRLEPILTQYKNQRRYEFLTNCTDMELRINKGRILIGLEPLPSEYFCQ